jgi:tRNA A-37 threonylcarbamoyl transferase component Bud32
MAITQSPNLAQDSGNGEVVFADAEARALLADRLELLRRPTEPRWRQVKHNVSRTVYRGRIGQQELYLKHFHNRSPVHRLLRRLGRSGAKRELTFSRYLRSRGVPTPAALAAACGPDAEWLATRAVAPAEPADRWHERQLDLGEAGRLAVQRATVRLAELIGRMHAAGVIHRDLHCGNVLVRAEGGGIDLVLMDLHRALRRRRLSRRAKAVNLAQLYHDRYYLTTRMERLRFLKHYLRASGAAGSLRGWQWMVEHFARMHTRRQHSQRDRRVFGDGRYFAAVRLEGGWRGHVVLASKRHMAGSKAAECPFTLEQWQQVLRRPEDLLEGDGVDVVKNSRSSLVVHRCLRVGPHELDVYVKRPRRKHKWKALADCFRRARPLRAFRLGHALLTRRIATALPLAALERRVGPVLLDSLLITEAVDAPRLNEFLNTWLAVPPRGDTPLGVSQQRSLAQEVLRHLGRLLQRLHDSSFAHRDLKASNLLIRWSPGTSPEIVLVDLDGLTPRRILTALRRYQGLMRLNVSLLKCPVVNRAGRLRMLMGYLRRPGCGRIDFKPYWRVLEEWSGKKLRQQIRSRRKRQKAVRRPGP